MKKIFGTLCLSFGLIGSVALAESDSQAANTESTKMPYAMGFKVPDNWRHNSNFVQQSPFTLQGDIPAHFDWRDQSGTTPIRDQKSCGSCWAFATSASMADNILIKDKQSRDLSEQYLVNCERHGWNCSGGFWAFDMFEEGRGTVYESDLPYTAANASCPANLNYKEKSSRWAFIGNAFETSPSNEDIKRAIMEFGPVTTGVNVTFMFQFYRGGVFSNCTPSTDKDLNHAVNIVGWDDAGGYWIMRNSWGSSWGEKGYMRIKYGCNGMGIASAYVNYKPTCQNQPVAISGPDKKIKLGESVQIGSPELAGKQLIWSPAEDMDDPTSPTPTVTPKESAIYTVRVTNECGAASSIVQVDVEKPTP
jgi:C1A family cysteine protease